MDIEEMLGGRIRRPRRRVTAVLATALAAVGLTMVPCAAAGPTESLRTALAAARGGAACGSLRADPTIDRVADKVNKSTDGWLDFTTRAVPETDALPALKDFGVNATKSAILSADTPDAGTAVKALILQGYAKIPECSYSSYGAATTFNAKKKLYVMTVVLVG